MSGLPALFGRDAVAQLIRSTATGAPALYRARPMPFMVASGVDSFYFPRDLSGDIKKPEPKQETPPEPKPTESGKFLCTDGTWRDEPKPVPIPEPVGPSRAQIRRERLTAELRTALDRNTK